MCLNLQSDARLGELTGQNTVLKKAVQIQAARLQERAAMEQEIGALRHALAQYQDQVGWRLLLLPMHDACGHVHGSAG